MVTTAFGNEPAKVSVRTIAIVLVGMAIGFALVKLVEFLMR